MIDIHCHILPYSDDGSESLEESLMMARAAASSGVKTVVMTPHCNLPDTDANHYFSSGLAQRYIQLHDEIQKAGIPLRVLPGAEVFFTPEVPSLLRRGVLPHLNGSDYLLVEFYFDTPPNEIRRGLESIRAEGCIPVLAHPERYHAVQETPQLAGGWFRDGVVLQVNKGSVLGRLGKDSFRAAAWILSHGFAHVLASDAHGAEVRTTRLDYLRELIENQFDPEYAEILLETNPKNIIRNLPILRAD